jgi:glycerol-3-phosphate dehydrogenase
MSSTSGRPFSAEGRVLNLADLAVADLDVLIVGGGITGAALALQATQRGYKTGLVDARDFASGTSSRSSKLVHGGFRYLAHGEVGLVHEALQERRRLREMFPDLVAPIPFLMPIPRRRRQAAILATGYWVYDALALGSGFPRHRRVSVEEARHMAPALRRSDIRGGWVSWDAQTDDAVLTVEIIRRAAAAGALVANHAELMSARREDARWLVEIRDRAGTGGSLQARAKYLVNAGGVWAHAIEGLTGRPPATKLRPSKGVHLSLSLQSLPIETSLVFPTGDGRVLFAIPWHNHVIVGTTDNDYGGDIENPACGPDEEADLLRAINRFFQLELGPEAVLSRWAGVRPLVARHDKPGEATKDLSRKPSIKLDQRGLLTVTGGKLTTCMRMAEHALQLLPRPGGNGAGPDAGPAAALDDRQSRRQRLITAEPQLSEPLPGNAGYLLADVADACDAGMALDLDDALSRRLRLSFLDVAAAREAAPAAANLMAQRLGWSSAEAQLIQFSEVLARDFGAARRAAV